jgi:hypothetical protein
MLRNEAFAVTMLGLYREGHSVQDICLHTGLAQERVITRLCAASRHLSRRNTAVLDPDQALGVQWEFVFWRA